MRSFIAYAGACTALLGTVVSSASANDVNPPSECSKHGYIQLFRDDVMVANVRAIAKTDFESEGWACEKTSQLDDLKCNKRQADDNSVTVLSENDICKTNDRHTFVFFHVIYQASIYDRNTYIATGTIGSPKARFYQLGSADGEVW